MMKKTKLIRGGIMALFVLAALLLVYLVVRQTMPDIIPLLRSGDEEALEAYLSRDMSFTGILYMALLQMVQVWSIVISGVIVNVAAGVVYGVWRAFAICLVSSSLAHGISFTLYQRLGKYLDKLLPDNSSDKLDIVAKSEHPAYMVVTLCFLFTFGHALLLMRFPLHTGSPSPARMQSRQRTSRRYRQSTGSERRQRQHASRQQRESS